MCAKEAIIMTDAKFVRPRTITPHHGELDGTATLLACHSVESPEPDPVTAMPEDGSDSSCSQIYPMSVDSESDLSSLGAASINVPLDAHVLPGRGRHLCAILPFLCVADDDNIVDVMSSVACQRHVWGIPQPAVGFALSKSGTIVTLVLSWMDAATRIVHVAFPSLFKNSSHQRTFAGRTVFPGGCVRSQCGNLGSRCSGVLPTCRSQR
ncbi:hypothetical protein DFH08DRAFT_793843 [Mycena albidolilacea]|uniref:Uncharacterized protein n=1 Tax=Mycena albidolilacea TaxID=1033008 RepID=A0AAD6Z2I0_9AGAR|nr:hypothetical protein DFH08DRAFT_793843 [Mycena albidolilacea]